MKDRQLNPLFLKARELFMKHGIRTLTMDDIAKELGISKKTIYKSVENKAELVKLTMQDFLAEEVHDLDAIQRESTNSIDEMIRMVDYFLKQTAGFNTSAMHDMQKYYPEAWQIYNEYRFRNALTRITLNLKKGVKEGMYRADLNTDIMAKIYIGGIDILMNQDFFPVKMYAFFDIYNEYLNYHLRGIVSAKGLKILDEHTLFKKQ